MSGSCTFCAYYVQHHNARCCCRYCHAERTKRADESATASPMPVAALTDCPHARPPHQCRQCVLPPYRQPSLATTARPLRAPVGTGPAACHSASPHRAAREHGRCACPGSCACRELVRPAARPRRGPAFDALDVPKMGPEAARYMREVPRPGQSTELDARLRFLY